MMIVCFAMMEIPPITFLTAKARCDCVFFLLELIQQQHGPFPQLRSRGSYPKPVFPLGSKLIYPGQSVPTTRLPCLVLQPPRSYGTELERSFKSKPWLIRATISHCFPHLSHQLRKARADQTPGKLKISTFNLNHPLSVFPVSSAMVSAFRRAFSSKVIPVSSTSGSSGY